tara:strand:+ start:8202 stop:8417 length:216 start_codon:yes stop_codon:yes gene_type:complete
MAFYIDMKEIDELIRIQKERQLVTQQLSEQLGIDISFSDEEVAKFAQEEILKKVNNSIKEEVEAWMKSVLS